MVSKKYKRKYRIESTRLKNYDYSSNGSYFITIITKNNVSNNGSSIPDLGVSNNYNGTPKLGISKSNFGVSSAKTHKKNHNPEWKSGTIGVIINQYKRICTIKSRKNFP